MKNKIKRSIGLFLCVIFCVSSLMGNTVSIQASEEAVPESETSIETAVPEESTWDVEELEQESESVSEIEESQADHTDSVESENQSEVPAEDLQTEEEQNTEVPQDEIETEVSETRDTETPHAAVVSRTSAVVFTVDNIKQAIAQKEGILTEEVDSNFVQTIYDSIIAQSNDFINGDSLESNPYTTMEELLNNFNGEIHARKKGIKSITGISILKSCTNIDLSFNEINDIRPISIVTDPDNVKPEEQIYYGTRGKDIIFNLMGNPIRQYPVQIGGRVKFVPELSNNSSLLNDHIFVFIMEDLGGHNYEVDIPLDLFRGTDRVDLDVGYLDDGEEYYFNEVDELSSRHNAAKETGAQYVSSVSGALSGIKIDSIKNSGIFALDLGILRSEGMGYYTIRNAASDRVTGTTQTLGWIIPVEIKMYTKVEKDAMDTKHSVSLTKLGLDDGEVKEGATYTLYKKIGTDVDPENDEKISTENLTTGADGKIAVSDLAAGNYYFLENTDVPAPAGYDINPTPVEFTLADGIIELKNKSGSGKVSDTEPGIDKGDGTKLDPIDGVYALGGDSDDDVTLTVTAPDNGALESLTLTWTGGNQGGTPGTMKYVVGSSTETVEGVTYVADMAEAVSKAEEQLKRCHELYQNVKISASFTQHIEREHKDPLVPAEISLDATKKLLYNNGGLVSELPAEEFSFTLENDPAYPDTPAFEQALTAKNKADGTIVFEAFKIGSEITETATNKTAEGYYEYHYLMKEVNAGDPNYQFDDSVFKITVTIGKNEKTGLLEKKSATFVKDGSAPGDTAEFENILNAVPFSFKKIDGNTKEALAGVKFALFMCKEGHTDDLDHSEMVTNPLSGCWVEKETVTSATDGIVKFSDLPSGDYQLVELETDSTYELPLGQWRIHVDAATMTIDIEAKGENTPPAFAIKGEGDKISYELPNYKKKVLPMAGGMGNVLYTGVGAVLIAFALILLFNSDKKYRRVGRKR